MSLKKKLIDSEKHYILEANHPSPLNANRGENKDKKIDTETCVLLRENFYICLENEKIEDCHKLANALYNCFKLKIL